jgi:hypothetical protein
MLGAVHPNPADTAPDGPLGSRNRQPARRYDVGKTVKRDRTLPPTNGAQLIKDQA